MAATFTPRLAAKVSLAGSLPTSDVGVVALAQAASTIPPTAQRRRLIMIDKCAGLLARVQLDAKPQG